MFEALSNSGLADFITGLSQLHKLIFESIHIAAGIVGIGALMVLDIRLLGASPAVPVARLAGPTLTLSALGFIVLFISGVAQFVPIAERVTTYWWFVTKMAAALAAVIATVWLALQVRRHASAWDAAGTIPRAVRFAAFATLVLWPAIAIWARMMFAFLQGTGVNSR